MSKHVDHLLFEYAAGKLPSEQRRAVEQHLENCAGCRAAMKAVGVVAPILRDLPKESPSNELWSRIQDGLQPSEAAKRAWRRPVVAAAAMLFIAAIAIHFWPVTPKVEQPYLWVTVTQGQCDVGSEARGEGQARLHVGEDLVTKADSEAVLGVGSLGKVTIAPGSRLALIQASEKEHRLRLLSGSLTAQINAPPRIFFVETQAATAVDLGCAYTLTAYPGGQGLLVVTSGWVMLEGKDIESLVPATFRCVIYPSGPGIPLRIAASTAFKTNVLKLETGDLTILDDLIGSAKREDALTLWHVLARVEGADRRRVFDRLSMAAPLPPEVSEEAILNLDRQAMRVWRDKIEPMTDFDFWNGLAP